jgi:predicted nucleic acid-binding protein
MSDIFLDTVGLLALLDEADQWHAGAQSAYERIKSEGRDFVTTPFVLLESGNSAARTRYRRAINEVRIDLEARQRIFVPTETEWEGAWRRYERHEIDRAGVVDHTSFQVMWRLGLRDAFTCDQHFRAAGFSVLF